MGRPSIIEKLYQENISVFIYSLYFITGMSNVVGVIQRLEPFTWGPLTLKR